MIFFFIHRFNDIDHFTPVIYRIAKDTEEKIMVLSLNPFYDLAGDFRLNFLKEHYNVRVDYLYNIYRPSFIYRIFGHFSRSYFLAPLHTNRLSQFVNRFFWTLLARFKIFDNMILKQYGEKWVNGMMAVFNPSVLIFDHAATPRIYNVRSLLNVSKRRRIPTVCLPHGIPLFIKHSSDYDRAKQDFIENEHDYLVLQHRWWRDECFEYGLSPQNVSVMGLARHCEEWERVLQRIVPPEPALKKKGAGKLKVVYMDSGPDRYHDYKTIVQQAIDRIAELDFIHLIYKPHTRRNVVHLQVPQSAEIAADINSVNLVKWADVVIGMHSSIMIEALIQKKIYISPTYFRERKMIYEEYGACWMVHSDEELVNALKRLHDDRSFRLYPDENVERFITDVVCNGQKNRDVLGTYKNFILTIAQRNQVTQGCGAEIYS